MDWRGTDSVGRLVNNDKWMNAEVPQVNNSKWRDSRVLIQVPRGKLSVVSAVSFRETAP